VPPFRLDLTVWALRRRPDNILDLWDGQTYRRALLIEGESASIAVTQTGLTENPVLEVTAFGSASSEILISSTSARVEKILGTRIDLTDFYRFAELNKDLGPLVLQFRGVKPPRSPTLFEALLNSISCQQISLSLCVRLLNRLVEKWGRSVSCREWKMQAFPVPQDLVDIEPEDLRKLGYSYNKARAIIELAALIAANKINLEEIAGLDDSAAIAALMRLKGVGHWTAEYTLLRGAGRTHIFPTGDSGALGNIRRWLGRDGNLSKEEVQFILNSWTPYAGLIYFHLLLRRLTELGYLK